MYFYCYVRSFLCIVYHCAFLCTLCVYMCIVLLPPGVNPIAVNKYIISYISYILFHIISYITSYIIRLHKQFTIFIRKTCVTRRYNVRHENKFDTASTPEFGNTGRKLTGTSKHISCES